MTVVLALHLPDSASNRVRLLGTDCRVEVSGLGRHAGLVLCEIPFSCCHFCYAWRRTDTGGELFETDESRRLTQFDHGLLRFIWTSPWVRRILGRWVTQQDESVARVLAWNDGTVEKLARTIANEKAFHLLPILADALEEAGCTDARMVSACRHPVEHMRSSWVVDMLLAVEICTTPHPALGRAGVVRRG